MSPAISPGQNFAERLVKLDLEWPKNLTEPGASLRRFCRSVTPHGGDLRSEPAELGYDDDGRGIWRLWIREEKRTVSKRTAELVAAKKALSLYNAPFDDLTRPVRKELVDKAKEELLAKAIPTIRITPVVMSTTLCFVGNRSIDPMTHALVMRAADTQLSMSPVAWTRTEEVAGVGWSALSLATLQEFLEGEGKNLDRDVEVEEIVIHGNLMRFRAFEMGPEAKASALAMMKAQPEGMRIDRLAFRVYRNGEPSAVVLDEQGLVSAAPPPSAGGLLHERLARRLADAQLLGERVGEVMKRILAKRNAN